MAKVTLTEEQCWETFAALDASLLATTGAKFGFAWRHEADAAAGKVIVSYTDAKVGSTVTATLTAVPSATDAAKIIKSLASEMKARAKAAKARSAADQDAKGFAK